MKEVQTVPFISEFLPTTFTLNNWVTLYRAVQEKVSYVEENYIKPLKAFEKKSGQSILSQVSTDIMHKIFAILDVNATEITELLDLFILYPIASLLEHSCLPNTSQTIDNEDGYKITFR